MSELHRLRKGYTDEHLPMFALLGLVSALDRFGELLDESSLSTPPAQNIGGHDTSIVNTAELDELAVLLLGLTSLREKVHELKAAALASRDFSEIIADRSLTLNELLR